MFIGKSADAYIYVKVYDTVDKSLNDRPVVLGGVINLDNP